MTRVARVRMSAYVAGRRCEARHNLEKDLVVRTKSISSVLLVTGLMLISCGLSTVATAPSVNSPVPLPSSTIPSISTPEPTSILPEGTLSPEQATAIALAGSLLSGTAAGSSATTPTRVPVQPALQGTPLPATAGKIAAANAAGVGEIARWGSGSASSVRYTPDGHLLAVSSSIGIYFYDPKTAQEIRHIDTQAKVTGLAFSPDGQTLAAIVDGHKVNLYNVANGAEVRNFTGDGAGVNAVAFSPDGKTLAYALSDLTVVLTDAAGGTDSHTLRGATNSPTGLGFLPDGKTVAAALTDETIILWDAISGDVLRTLSAASAIAPNGTTSDADLAVSPDGKALVAAHDEQELIIWDPATGQALHTMRGDKPSTTFMSVAFSPDRMTLAAGTGDLTTWLIDVKTGAKIKEFPGLGEHMVYSPEGQSIAMTDAYGRVRIVDAKTGRDQVVLDRHDSAIREIALSADGRTLIAAFSDYAFVSGFLKAFSVAGGTSRDLSGVDCQSPFVLSADGRSVAVVCHPPRSGNDEVGLIEVAGGSPPRILTAQPFETGVDLAALAFSPDGRTLALGMDRDYIGAPQIRFVSVAGGGSRNSQAPWTIPVASLAFSPDGKWLAQGPVEMVQTEGGPPIETKVSIWDVATAMEILGLAGYKNSVVSLVFSPDGKTLATGNNEDGRIRVWALPGGQEIHELERAGFAIHLAYSPDGSLLITGTSDGKITIWDTSTWSQVATLSGHTGAVTGVAFTPDGQYIVSGSEDGTIRFWAVHP
jgi:WD40 repeat protein